MEVSELPEAVELEILSKLPVKSLARFRCVCKGWSSSSQTSHFITRHYRNNVRNNNLNLLISRDDCGNTPPHSIFSTLSQGRRRRDFVVAVEEDIQLPFLDNCRPWPHVYGPCNGLVCLEHVINRNLALWNPSTREFKLIPESTVPRPPSTADTSFGHLGFGFDSTAHDYKVVRFVANYINKDWTFQVELYSLQTDSWKEISLPEAGARILLLLSFHKYSNGVYYWVTSDDDHLLSFHMADEKFSTLPLPKYGGSHRWVLFDSNGLLAAIRYPLGVKEKTFDLWVMNHNGSWTRQFNIEYIPGVVFPLGLWKDGQIFLQRSNGELVLFDPATKEAKNLGIHAHPFKMGLTVYVESLVPINGRSEYDQHIIRRPAGEVLNGHSKQRRGKPRVVPNNKRRGKRKSGSQ